MTLLRVALPRALQITVAIGLAVAVADIGAIDARCDSWQSRLRQLEA